MPIDASIPLQANNEPLQRGLASLQDSLNPVSQYSKLIGLQNLSNESQLNQLKLKNATQADADEQKWRDAYQQSGGDTGKLATLLSSSGISPKLALESNKLVQDQEKSRMDNAKSKSELMMTAFTPVLAAKTKKSALDAITTLEQSSGIKAPQNIQDQVNSLPDDPQIIYQWALGLTNHAKDLLPKESNVNFGDRQSLGSYYPGIGRVENSSTPIAVSPNTLATNQTNREIFLGKQALDVAEKNRPQIKDVNGQKITTVPYQLSQPGLLPLEPSNPLVNGALNQGLSTPPLENNSRQRNTLATLNQSQNQNGQVAPIIPDITSFPPPGKSLQASSQRNQQPSTVLPTSNKMVSGTSTAEDIPGSAEAIDRKRTDASHIDAINNALKSIDSLQENNNKKINDAASVAGRISSHIPYIDTDSKAGRAELEVLQGAARALGVQMLKGSGNVSNAEGAASAKAFANLDPDKVPKEMLAKQVQNFKELLLSQRSRFLPSQSNNNNSQNQKIDAQQRATVKTGTHNGKKVIQYSDGSIEYAN